MESETERVEGKGDRKKKLTGVGVLGRGRVGGRGGGRGGARGGGRGGGGWGKKRQKKN